MSDEEEKGMEVRREILYQEFADLKARNDQLQDSLSKAESALETSKSDT